MLGSHRKLKTRVKYQTYNLDGEQTTECLLKNKSVALALLINKIKICNMSKI